MSNPTIVNFYSELTNVKRDYEQTSRNLKDERERSYFLKERISQSVLKSEETEQQLEDISGTLNESRRKREEISIRFVSKERSLNELQKRYVCEVRDLKKRKKELSEIRSVSPMNFFSPEYPMSRSTFVKEMFDFETKIENDGYENNLKNKLKSSLLKEKEKFLNQKNENDAIEHKIRTLKAQCEKVRREIVKLNDVELIKKEEALKSRKLEYNEAQDRERRQIVRQKEDLERCRVEYSNLCGDCVSISQEIAKIKSDNEKKFHQINSLGQAETKIASRKSMLEIEMRKIQNRIEHLKSGNQFVPASNFAGGIGSSQENGYKRTPHPGRQFPGRGQGNNYPRREHNQLQRPTTTFRQPNFSQGSSNTGFPPQQRTMNRGFRPPPPNYVQQRVTAPTPNSDSFRGVNSRSMSGGERNYTQKNTQATTKKRGFPNNTKRMRHMVQAFGRGKSKTKTLSAPSLPPGVYDTDDMLLEEKLMPEPKRRKTE